MKRISMLLALTLLSAGAVYAQPHGTSEPGGTRSEVKLLGYEFYNFFQATDPAMEQDVRAFATEYRLAWRPGQSAAEVYGHANWMNFLENRLNNTYGGRVGLDANGKVHQFNVYVDQQQNRPSFEVGNTFGQADTTTFYGEYSIRPVDAWQVGAEGIHQKQVFTNRLRNNKFNEFGAMARYRGFGWKFTPEVGAHRGHRSVDLETESYDENDWYAQMAFIPVDWFYASVRYTDRKRDYTIDNPLSSNFDRAEKRPQWTGLIDVKAAKWVSILVYYSREDVSSSDPSRDFKDSLILVGPEFRF